MLQEVYFVVKVGLTFNFVGEISIVIIFIKAAEHDFPAVLFTFCRRRLYFVESVDEENSLLTLTLLFFVVCCFCPRTK